MVLSDNLQLLWIVFLLLSGLMLEILLNGSLDWWLATFVGLLVNVELLFSSLETKR